MPFEPFEHGLRTDTDGRIVGNPYIIWDQWVRSVAGVELKDCAVTTLMVSSGSIDNL
jgi:hypothetical protein